MKNVKNTTYILPLALWLLTGCAASRYADFESDQIYNDGSASVSANDAPSFGAKDKSARRAGVAVAATGNGGAVASNDATVSAGSKTQSQRNYELLFAEAQQLNDDINYLNQQLLGGLSRGKSKKVTNELGVLAGQLSAVERKMAAYPKSVIVPGYVDPAENAAKEQFRQELVQKAEQSRGRGGAHGAFSASDFDSIADPEIRRAYQMYAGAPVSSSPSSTSSAAALNKVVYSVQVGVGRAGNAAAYHGLSGVRELNGPNGAIYYTGQYSSLAQAKAACRQVRSMGRYNDAFVIAIMNQRRISLKQAELYSL